LSYCETQKRRDAQRKRIRMEERWMSRSSKRLLVAAALAVSANPAYSLDLSAPQVVAQRICMVAGEFSQIEATINSTDPKVVVRLYFRSNLSPETYFVKMTPVGTPEPGTGTWRVRGVLPKATLQASPVTYRAEVRSAGGTVRSPEIVVTVVRTKQACDEGVAAAVATNNVVTVFDAGGAKAGGGVLGEGRRSFVITAAEMLTAGALASGGFAFLTRESRGEPQSDPYGPASACR
jgi:hypothetical protein